jgi:hypothetical protein
LFWVSPPPPSRCSFPPRECTGSRSVRCTRGPTFRGVAAGWIGRARPVPVHPAGRSAGGAGRPGTAGRAAACSARRLGRSGGCAAGHHRDRSGHRRLRRAPGPPSRPARASAARRGHPGRRGPDQRADAAAYRPARTARCRRPAGLRPSRRPRHRGCGRGFGGRPAAPGRAASRPAHPAGRQQPLRRRFRRPAAPGRAASRRWWGCSGHPRPGRCSRPGRSRSGGPPSRWPAPGRPSG